MGQGKKAKDWDYQLSAVYTICFMNVQSSGLPLRKFRTDVGLMDMQALKPVSDKFRLIYLRLPLFPRKTAAACENDFERWIYVLKNMETLERMPFQAQNAVFEKLAAITDVSALSQKDQERYEESLRIYRDNYAADQYSFNRGLARGIEKGRTAERTVIARNLKESGVDIQVIIHSTGLTKEQIDQL